ncbi:hypothetical protein Taro_007322 [Colocasia esculenta]|uniref:CCHC-type domain-containing protein n=1 Tax=Colocasia esculenta TaxID=4460 RepID=A0A843U3I1_COLES|nr:hypothetical protein [Colocasia esculenta]
MCELLRASLLIPFPSGGSWSTFEVRGAVSLRGWSRLAVVGATQAQPSPSRQVQQQTGSQPDSRVRRRFRRSRRLTEQRQLPVESVQQFGVQPQQQSQHLFSGRCYRCNQLGHMAQDCPQLRHDQWLTGARGKTLVREAELDRAENSRSGGDSREKASRGSARIELVG